MTPYDQRTVLPFLLFSNFYASIYFVWKKLILVPMNFEKESKNIFFNMKA